MSTIVSMDVFERLNDLIRIPAVEFTSEIREEMESLFKECAEGMELDSEKFLCSLMLKALDKRLFSDAPNENIYLKNYEISQIELFDILIDKFPFVKFSQQLVNHEIARLISEEEEACIIDIGIGLGTQMVNIIQLVKMATGLKKLHIVGIEPGGDTLEIAKSNILSLKEKVDFDIEFTGIHGFAEDIDFKNIPNLTGTVVVNASLALHHIQSAAMRTRTLANVKSINPKALMLIEPNVNHYEIDFYTRFKNCYHHFYSIFKVIDRLDIRHNDKNALKQFFGREIEDIIGKPEADRFEKHEPAIQWITRLKENQYQLNSQLLKAPMQTPEGVQMNYHPEGFVGFTFENETVLSIIYAN